MVPCIKCVTQDTYVVLIEKIVNNVALFEMSHISNITPVTELLVKFLFD